MDGVHEDLKGMLALRGEVTARESRRRRLGIASAEALIHAGLGLKLFFAILLHLTDNMQLYHQSKSTNTLGNILTKSMCLLLHT